MEVRHIDYDIVEVAGVYEIRPFDPEIDWVSERDGGSTIKTFIEKEKFAGSRGIYIDLERNIVIIIR